MNNHKLSPSPRLFFVLTLALFTLLPLVSGCTSGRYGRLDLDMSVNDTFESGRILADHTYYYSGPEAEPWAIMAIDNRYQLAPGLWNKIDLTAEQLDRWMRRIDNRYRFKTFYRGAVIRDREGERIGLWYSPWDWTVIRRGEGNEVTIYTPDVRSEHDEFGSHSVFWGGRN